MRFEHWLYTIPLRLRSLFRRDQVEQELGEELQYHIEQQIQAYIDKGLSAKEARYLALRSMGGVEQRKEQCRTMRRINFIDDLLQDLSYGARMLRRSPGFTLIAVMTLALGIGANTAIFSTINAVLFRVLPFKQPDRLVQIFQSRNSRQNMDRMRVAPANYLDWKKDNKSFEAFAAYRLTSLNLTGDNNPERVRAAQTSVNTFSVLGVEPLLGRAFLPEEENPGSDSVAVLGYSLWHRRFADDRNIIGKAIRADGRQYTIIGVVPPDFRFPIGWLSGDVEIWTPLALTTQEINNRAAITLDVVARLNDGVSREQSQASLTVIAQQLEQSYPESNKGWGVNVMLLNDRGILGYGSLFLFLWLSVTVVLLIACANVANLLLARGIQRQKELTIRAALGARRLRILRQLLTEGVMLSGLGGLVGVLLAFYGTRILVAVAPTSNLPELKQVGLDWRVLAFSLVLTVVTGLLFSLFPALTLSTFSLRDALQEGSRIGSDSLRRSRMKSALVIGELALTLTLLLCSGSLIKSFQSYMSIDPGFESENVLAMRVSLPAEKYKQKDQWTAFFDRAQEEMKTIPGVLSVAVGDGAPLEDGGEVFAYNVVGKPMPDFSKRVITGYFRVSPDYFRTVGIKLRRGRHFDSNDVEGSPRVAIVNEAFVKREFPGKDPIGERITLLGDVNRSAGYETTSSSVEIVGVVASTKEFTFYLDVPTMIYVPTRQDQPRTMSLLIKTAGDPTKLLPEIRARLLGIDPDQPVYNIRTVDQIIGTTHSLFRFNTLLLTAFAAIALILSLIGIYGVLAYMVSQSTKEFGIRLALGCRPRDIFKLVLGKGAVLSVIGLGLGLAASSPAIKFMAKSLKESMGLDLVSTGPLLLVAVCGAMTIVVLLACFIPARRATKVDPMTALRYE